MGHWDAIYRDRSLGRTATTSNGVGGVKRQDRTEEVLFEARFVCPVCANFLAPGVQCDPCSAWAVDRTSRLHLMADTDSIGARFSRWHEVRAARLRREAGMTRATVVSVQEDCTPADPERRVAAYASREHSGYHTICGGFIVEVSSGDPYRVAQIRLTIERAHVVAPSLTRGERRELVAGDQVILSGEQRDELFHGDVWLDGE